MDSNKELEVHSQNALAQTRLVCDTFGGRGAGSDSENRCQEYFANVLRTITPDVDIEQFDVHPHAFMFFDPIFAALSMVSVIFFWLGFAWVAWFLCHVGFVVMLLELGLYKQFLDPLFPNRVSSNVVAKIHRHGKGKTKRRVVISGHTDSAFCWTFNFGHPIVLWLSHALQMGSSVVILLTNYLRPLLSDNVLFWIHIACVIALTTTFFNTNFKKPVPGANDDLSGATAAIELGIFFHKHKELLDNCEVWIVLTGSEEVGLRGAKAFAASHRRELTGGDGVETLFLGLETLREPEHLSIAYKEMNGLVHVDQRVVNLLMCAAKNSLGKELKKQSVYCGSTDSAALTQIGCSACTLEGMSPGPPTWYHTMRDNPSNMNRVCVLQAMQVVVEAVQLFDKHGLCTFNQNKLV